MEELLIFDGRWLMEKAPLDSNQKSAISNQKSR